MNEPQIWTVIGVFAATLVGLIAVITQLFMRSLSSQSDSISSQFAALRTEMVLRFEHQDERFGRIEKQLEGLERDVHAISKRVFPE